MMKSLIIAGTHSGSGKTTITLGIMECLKRRGLRVAPFKVGPDFIDPGYHRLVTGKPSVNLDGWMCSENFVQETFFRHLEGSDIAVIEGVMGLFDGIGGNSDSGSTAQIARIIGSPVILLVDAKSQGRSAAALVKGFAEFDPGVRIAGVIFNNVGSDGHARVLREAVESLDMGIKVIGCLPRDERLHIPSRHLGLTTVEENPLSGEFIELLVEILWDRLDLGLLWASGTQYGVEQNLPWTKQSASRGIAGKKERVRLALARDIAFCFVYEDNLRLLREAGAEIVEFSPLSDRELPEGTAGIYLPGGYPELFTDALSGNVEMKRAIKAGIADGMPVYAECGGFIYLTRGVKAEPWEKKEEGLSSGDASAVRNTLPLHEFVGAFPVTTRMLPRRKALGYREVKTGADSIFGPSGIEARGHEFHYSEMGEMPKRVKRVYGVSRNHVLLGKEGYIHKNCLASYIHLHFGSNPGIAEAFVENCRKYISGKGGGKKTGAGRKAKVE